MRRVHPSSEDKELEWKRGGYSLDMGETGVICQGAGGWVRFGWHLWTAVLCLTQEEAAELIPGLQETSLCSQSSPQPLSGLVTLL